jgi:hypothetical protein
MENITAHLPLERNPATTHQPRKNALTSKSSRDEIFGVT